MPSKNVDPTEPCFVMSVDCMCSSNGVCGLTLANFPENPLVGHYGFFVFLLALVEVYVYPKLLRDSIGFETWNFWNFMEMKNFFLVTMVNFWKTINISSAIQFHLLTCIFESMLTISENLTCHQIDIFTMISKVPRDLNPQFV